jgi:hypothetical protein
MPSDEQEDNAGIVAPPPLIYLALGAPSAASGSGKD